MKKTIKLIILILALVPNFAFANQQAWVFLDISISNIAIKENIVESKIDVPDEKIKKIYSEYRSQVALERRININFHFFNYLFSDDLLCTIPEVSDAGIGYHLLDIFWFRPRLAVGYKNSRGIWEKQSNWPTGHRFVTKTDALIVGSHVESLFVTPGISLPTAETPQIIGGIKESKVAEFKGKNYYVDVILSPIIRSFFIHKKPSEIVNNKLEIIGDIDFGNSSIEAITGPFFYPFDEYQLGLNFRSRYPIKVIINTINTEDLLLNDPKRREIVLAKDEIKGVTLKLIRKNIWVNFFWPVMALIISILFKQVNNNNYRSFFYFFSLLSIYFGMPKPINVPVFNLLYFVTWFIFFIVIFIVEEWRSNFRVIKKVFSKMCAFSFIKRGSSPIPL